MNGTIKMYNSQKGYGFISSISGDIFFHVSSVTNREIIPEVGMNATFEIREGQKGKEAFCIRLIIDNKPKFIILGNDRIKLSNITNYGIVDRLPPPSRYIIYLTPPPDGPYLNINTYQGENYRYFQSEVNFDIYEKLKELDEYFT